MAGRPTCPACGSTDVHFSERRNVYVCIDCDHKFALADERASRRIFLSYGHNEHAALAQRLKVDLEGAGHEVWFDVDRLVPGPDWEAYIDEGLRRVAADPAGGRVVLLLTPHSVRRPDGFCLNELARAISLGVPIVPVMVAWCELPLSICRLQWLDMRDCLPVEQRPERYEARLEQLRRAVQHDDIDFEGNQSRLLQMLEPLPFDADFARHLERFTGREPVIARVRAWLADPDGASLYWITGDPGVGKTALSLKLASRLREIAALHLCVHNHTQKSDPRRCVMSVAYQLASQLADYMDRLAALDLADILSEANATTLFDRLIAQPLAGGFPAPDGAVAVLIDALDEATHDGSNELASFLATAQSRTPPWLRFIVTSRREPEVLHALQGFDADHLSRADDDNQSDIRSFVLREFAGFAVDGVLTDVVVDAIVERSEGTFLYVEHVRRELGRGRLSLEDVEAFPRGLGGVYAQFFERQFADLDAFKDRIRPVLEIVAAALEPPPVALLVSLFAWDDYARTERLNELGSLFPHEGGRVRTFHRSVYEWMTEPDAAGARFVSPAGGHERLATTGVKGWRADDAAVASYFRAHLPAHLLATSRWDVLADVLVDLDYLQAKVDGPGTSVIDVRADLDAAVAQMPDDARRRRLFLISEILRIDGNVVLRNPQALFSCCYNRGWWYDAPAAANFYVEPDGDWPAPGPPWAHPEPALHALMSAWREKREAAGPFVWLRALKPMPEALGAGQIVMAHGHDDASVEIGLSPDGRQLAAGVEGGLIQLWDTATGRKLAERSCEEGPCVLGFLPNGELLVNDWEGPALEFLDAGNLETRDRLALAGDDVSAGAVSPDSEAAAQVIDCSQAADDPKRT